MSACTLAAMVVSAGSLGIALLPGTIGTVAGYAVLLMHAALWVTLGVLTHRLVGFSPKREWIRAARSARTLFIGAPCSLALGLILLVTAVCLAGLWRGAAALAVMSGILVIVGTLAPALAYWNTLNLTKMLGTWSRDRRLRRWSAGGRYMFLLLIALGLGLISLGKNMGAESGWSDAVDPVLALGGIAWTAVMFFVYRLAIGSLRRAAASKAAGPEAPPPAVQAAIEAARLMGQMRRRHEDTQPPAQQAPPDRDG